jgi:isopenicillin N synthase-like dioxygenase
VQLAAHRDQSVLTLLQQSSGSSGLQVATADGQWLDAPPIEGALLVNAGDYLERLSGGQVPSASHRVVGCSGTDNQLRYSVAFFASPTWDFALSADEQVGDGVPFYG